MAGPALFSNRAATAIPGHFHGERVFRYARPPHQPVGKQSMTAMELTALIETVKDLREREAVLRRYL